METGAIKAMVPNYQEKKNLKTLIERLVSLDIMGFQLRACLKPLNTIGCSDGPGNFKEGPHLVPHDAERHQSFPQHKAG